MNMRLFLYLLIIMSIFQACTLFPKSEQLLSEHQRADGSKIRIYYVGLGATTKDVIQVRKSGQDLPIWVTDNYNCLNKAELLGDTLLRLVLSDTMYNNMKYKIDTIIINVK